MTSRRRDVDIARGLAILLILVHHMAQYFWRYVPDSFDEQAWSRVVTVVSYVNVPSFMLLAGMMLGLSSRQVRTAGEYGSFILGKVQRVLLPFLAISLVSLGIKVFAPGGKAHPADLTTVVNVLLAPRGGPAGHLWFLYCLLSVFIVWPALRAMTPPRLLPALWAALLALAIAPIPWPMRALAQPLLGLADLAWYLPLFGLGAMHARRILSLGSSGAAILPAACVWAASVAAGMIWHDQAHWALATAMSALKWLGYVSGCLALVWTACLIDRHTRRAGQVIARVGLRSYDIYLLHVAFVGHPMAYAAMRLGAGPGLAAGMFAASLALGIALPMAMARAIRLWPTAAMVLLGDVRRRNPRRQAGVPEA